MPIDKPKRSGWTAVFGGVVLLAMGYATAYLMLMEPVPVEFWSGHTATYPRPSLRRLFTPAYWIDRNIVHPQFWQEPR